MSELIGQLGGKATTGADPVAVTDTESTVVGPVDVQMWDRCTVYVKNEGGGGGHALTLCNIETAPLEAGPWVPHDTCLSANLASGAAVAPFFFNLSMKYVRIRAKCGAANNTTIRVWVSVGGHP